MRELVNISTVSVIGVTGTMGANIAGIFASFGNAKVYCIGRDIEKVKNTIPRMAASVKAGSIATRLIPADYSMLDECVRQSDLVFESVADPSTACWTSMISSCNQNGCFEEAIDVFMQMQKDIQRIKWPLYQWI